MNKKKHIIQNFIRFVAEKYNNEEVEKENQTTPDKNEDEVIKKELEDDLIDIIEEFKNRYER
jgi:hypothetical protein